MSWRDIAWFTSFGIAVASAVWMRSLGFGWPATLGAAVVIWVGLPFVTKQLYAILVLGGVSRKQIATLERVAERYQRRNNTNDL
jgi:hypothetical protein